MFNASVHPVLRAILIRTDVSVARFVPEMKNVLEERLATPEEVEFASILVQRHYAGRTPIVYPKDIRPFVNVSLVLLEIHWTWKEAVSLVSTSNFKSCYK